MEEEMEEGVKKKKKQEEEEFTLRIAPSIRKFRWYINTATQKYKARANQCIKTLASYKLSFSSSLFVPPSPPPCIFRHFNFRLDLDPAVLVARVKHLCRLSGEPDPGFVSAAVGNAEGWLEALEKKKKAVVSPSEWVKETLIEPFSFLCLLIYFWSHLDI